MAYKQGITDRFFCDIFDDAKKWESMHVGESKSITGMLTMSDDLALFLKISLNPCENREVGYAAVGTYYEVLVYMITNSIIHQRVSPNFLGSYGSSLSCDVSSIMKHLTRLGYGGKSVQGLRRKGLKGVVLAVEAVGPNTLMTLGDYVDANRNSDLNVETYLLLFQCIMAIITLGVAGVQHNDTHPGNIFCIPNTKKKQLNYFYDGIYYSFTPKYIAKLFDFDRSYSALLGDNVSLKTLGLADMYTQRNVVKPIVDIVRLLLGTYMRNVVDLITDDDNMKKFLTTFCDVSNECAFISINGILLNTMKYAIRNDTGMTAKDTAIFDMFKGIPYAGRNSLPDALFDTLDIGYIVERVANKGDVILDVDKPKGHVYDASNYKRRTLEQLIAQCEDCDE